MTKDDLARIRDQEAKSHIEVYSSATLYASGSWLQKPVKTILQILPYFSAHDTLRILDLGCGVGRNSIAIAQYFQGRDCCIDCVDILEIAIQRLLDYAKCYQVLPHIRPFQIPIDDFPIPPSSYHWILAVSALEHMNSEASFQEKLCQIRDGICSDGIVSLILNSEVSEQSKATGLPRCPQFEVNLSTSKMIALLTSIFSGWEIRNLSVREQVYEVPRLDDISVLQSNVVTFVAKK